MQDATSAFNQRSITYSLMDGSQHQKRISVREKGFKERLLGLVVGAVDESFKALLRKEKKLKNTRPVHSK